MGISINDSRCDLFKRFYPLNLIEEEYLPQLAGKSSIVLVEAGTSLLNNANTLRLHYLVEGDIEIRPSFCSDEQLTDNQGSSDIPLEEYIKSGKTITAATDCQILSVKADFVDELLTRCHSKGYKLVCETEQHSNIADQMVCRKYKQNWLETFLLSSLATQLHISKLQELIRALTEIDVKAGEVLTKCQTPGEYFYVIKEGIAAIAAENNRELHQEWIKLGAGDYFGDEALVANTMHNVSVIMVTDGVLGRMPGDLFNEILKSSLLVPMFDEDILLSVDQSRCCCLDVRNTVEYRHGHKKESEHLPIDFIRENIARMDPDMTYLFTAEGGRRSVLATFILRQAGFEAYYSGNSISM